MGKFLSKHQILQADDRTVQEVQIPEWGGSVLVKALSVAGRTALEDFALYLDEEGKLIQDNRKQRIGLVALSIVDEKGNALFTMEDIEALNEKSFSAIERVFDVARALSFPKIEQVVKN